MAAMDETGQREQTSGRSVSVYVLAADATALELAALDEARRFFGGEVRLVIVRDYKVATYTTNDPAQRYGASITVHEVAQTGRS
jgi:hypothetical protein